MLSALKDLGIELEIRFGKDRGAKLLQSWDRNILECISEKRDPSFLEFARNQLTTDEFKVSELWVQEQHIIQQQAMAQFAEEVAQGFNRMDEGFNRMDEGFQDNRQRLIRIEKEHVCWCCFL
jgi:hypothetical protein